MSKKLTVKTVVGKKVDAYWHINPNETKALVPLTMKIGDNVHICDGTIFAPDQSIPDSAFIGGYYEVKWACQGDDEVGLIERAYNPNGEDPFMKNGDAAYILKSSRSLLDCLG